jgi:hypothetical protein
MKRYIVGVICLLVGGFVFAQTPTAGAVDASKIASDTAQQSLKEVSIDKFEHDGFWYASISSDKGIAVSRLFEGGPEEKEQIDDEKSLNIPDKYVLGTRVDFYHRGPVTFSVLALQPIPVEGITKTISVWAVGRNFNHELKVIVEDYFGRRFRLSLGRLNFQGWKQLSVAVPPQEDGSNNGIAQQSYHYNNELGIKVVGFEVECDPLETYGTYYLYLDDLRAVTDLFAEDNRDNDDMADAW